MFKSIVSFFTQSSEDPAKTSATLTGFLIMAATWTQANLTFIPAVATFFASPLGAQLQPELTAVGYILGGVWALFGIYRKVTNTVAGALGVR